VVVDVVVLLSTAMSVASAAVRVLLTLAPSGAAAAVVLALADLLAVPVDMAAPKAATVVAWVVVATATHPAPQVLVPTLGGRLPKLANDRPALLGPLTLRSCFSFSL